MGLDLVEMVMALEEEFSIELQNDELERAPTVGLMFERIRMRVAPNSPSGQFSGELWERYVSIIGRELGVDRQRVQPTAHFVKDLGAS